MTIIDDEPQRLMHKTPSMRVKTLAEVVPEVIVENRTRSPKMAVDEALQTLKAGDASLKDKWVALRILLFLTFEDPNSSRVAYFLSIFLFLSIIVNCAAFIIGSVKGTQYQPETCAKPVCVPGEGSPCTKMICLPMESPTLWYLEFWTIIIFSVDYMVRILCVHAVPNDLVCPRSLAFTVDGKIKDRSARPELSPVGKTVKYMLTWLNIVDLISILPFYISMSISDAKVSKDLGVMRVLRLFRVMRVFKLGKYSEGGMIIGRTLRASLPALVLFVFLTAILTIIFGSFMYFFEGGNFMVTQEFPAGGFLRDTARGTTKELTPFTSILMGMYWVVVNTTTLGNCALYPTTVMGRICSCIVAYAGILSLALPISIVGKNFTEQYNMVYNLTGGQFELAPAETAAINHDRMLQKKKNEEDAAAADKGFDTAATVIDPFNKKGGVVSAAPSSSELLVAELHARMARMEQEMEALKAQIRNSQMSQQQ